MIYILIVLYTLLLVYHYDIKAATNGKEFNFRFLLFISIAVVGVSYRLGLDTVGYMEYFERVDPNILYTFNNLFDLRYEPIPELLFSFCKGLLDDFVVVQIVIGVFVNITVFWFLRKHSPMPFFSIFLYFIFQYWNLNFEIKRESVAICIFLIAIDKLLKEELNKKDFLWYYGICFIASFAHRFAFIAFIYPLFLRLKFSKAYIVIFSTATIVLLIYSSFIVNVMTPINAFLSLYSGEAIQHYLESDRFGSGGVSILGMFNKIIIPLFIIYNIKNIRNPKIYSLTLLYFIVSLFQTQVFIFYRLTNYLCIFLFIVYAYCVKDIVDGKLRSTLVNILFTVSLLFHIYLLTGKEQHIRYSPYSSIFDKEINQERESTYEDLDLLLNH